MKRACAILAILCVYLLSWKGNIFAAECPRTLEIASTGSWYITAPSFSEVTQIHLVAEMTNNSFPQNFSLYGPATFNLWSVPGGINTMPVTVNAAPSGTVNSGENFTYDLTIDVSSLPATEYSLAFRPRSGIQMSPFDAPLVSASISCMPPPSASIPTLNEWGIIIFLFGAGSLAIYFLRTKNTTSEILY